MDAAAARHGGISNTIVRTEERVMIVSHRETEKARRRWWPRCGRRSNLAGIGPQPDWRTYEVLRHRTS